MLRFRNRGIVPHTVNVRTEDLALLLDVVVTVHIIGDTHGDLRKVHRLPCLGAAGPFRRGPAGKEESSSKTQQEEPGHNDQK